MQESDSPIYKLNDSSLINESFSFDANASTSFTEEVKLQNSELNKKLEAKEEEIRNLRAQLQEAKNESDEYKSINEILQGKIVENERKFTNEKERMTQFQRQLKKNTEDQINQLTKEKEDLIKQLNKSKENQVNISEEQSSEISAMKKDTEDFIRKCSTLYNDDFKSLDDVYEMLSNIQNQDPITLPVINNEDAERILAQKKKIKDLKNKLKDAMIQSKEQQEEKENEIQKKSEYINKLVAESQEAELNHNKKIGSLEMEKNALNEKIKSLQQLNTLQEKKFNELVKNQANDKIINKLKADNTKIAEKLSKIKGKFDKLGRAFLDSQSTIKQQDAQIEELQKELTELQLQNADVVEINKEVSEENQEIKDSLDKIHDEMTKLKQESNNSLTELENENNELKKKNDLLNASQKKDQQEIKELTNAISKLKKQTNDYNKQNEALNTKLKELQEKADKEQEEYKKQTGSMRKQVEDLEEKLKESTELQLPANVWASLDNAKPELKEKLAEIGHDNSMKTPEKVISAFNTINEFMTNIVEEKEQESETESNTFVDLLLSKLSPLLGTTTTTKSSSTLIANKKEGDNYLTALAATVSSFIQMKDKYDSYMSILKEASKTLRVPFLSINEKITELLNTQFTFDSDRESLVTEIMKLRKSEERLKKSFQSFVDQYKGEIDQQEKQIEELTEENTRIKKELHSKNLAVQAQELKISSLENSKEIEIESKEREHAENLELIENQLRLEIQEQKYKIEEYENELNNKSKVERKYQKLKALHYKQVEELQKEIEETRAEMERVQKEDHELADKEIKQLAQNLESTIISQKDKITALEKQIIDMTRVLKDTQSELKQKEKVLSDLQTDKKKAARTLSRIEEKSELNKRILETQIKANQVSIDNKHMEEIEKLKESNVIERRAFVTFITKQFMQYYDLSTKIDEETCKSIVCKAKEDLERLNNMESSLRMILGISEDSSIEEAVSSLLKYNIL